MRIGLDFDNTIVCYDEAIALLAEELLELPKELPRTKVALRNFLHTAGREPEWTSFQGELYGPGMRHARTYEGAIETMLQLSAAGYEMVIVSHRTRLPYAGHPHDLHASARRWVADRLQNIGLFTKDECCVNFLETRDEKVARIAKLGCNAFLDDLQEVLNHSGFPANTVRVLFDPSGNSDRQGNQHCISRWPELIDVLGAKP